MNGCWFDESGRIEAVPVDDRGLQYGDGLFETIAIRSGRARLWELHIERLQLGCVRLAIEIPPETMLRKLLNGALEETGDLAVGLAKIIVTRGSAERGYRYSGGLRPRILLGLFARTDFPSAFRTEGVSVRLCSTRLAAQPALAGIKSLNRLEQVLARNEWRDESISEGLMLNGEDEVVCGTMGNVFVVIDSALRTPPVTTAGVCGIMRRHILAVADENDIAVKVEPVSVEEIQLVSEIFLCNSQFGIWPVRHCGVRVLEAPGALTRKLMTLLAESGIEECSL
jgi:4-amino-4-deoxychorismate lyase